MDKETYGKKRRALQQLYPVYLSKRWLRNTRIAFSVMILIGVKLTQSTLPVFDITCLHDNVLAWFLKFQPKPESASVAAFVAAFFSLFGLSLAAAVLNWFFLSDSLRQPLAVLVFYLAKFFSDTSLVLHKPWKVLWPEMTFLGMEVEPNSFFFSNVCPFSGLLALFFLFSFSIENWFLRKALLGLSLISFGVSSFVQLTFQLVHSFAIFSGLICAVFAFLVSENIEPYFEKKLLGGVASVAPAPVPAEPADFGSNSDGPSSQLDF